MQRARLIHRGGLSALALALALGAGRAGAAAPDEKLHAVEQKLEAGRAESAALDRRAAALAAERARLQSASVAAASAALGYEGRLSALEAQLATLDREASGRQAALTADRQRETMLLAALERLSLNPAEAMLFQPAPPIDQVRAALLLGAVVPRLEADAKSLRDRLADLARLKADIVAKRAEMVQKQAALDAERTRITILMRQKAAFEGQAREAQGQTQTKLAALSAEASDLKDLIQRLDRQRQARLDADRKRADEAEARAEHAAAPKAEPAHRPDRGAHENTHRMEPGAYALPVAGTLVKHFGDSDGFQEAKGLTFRTRSSAQVVAPFDGQILFAGPFKGYGQILIIDHGEGYHSLLAGIDQIEATVGQRIVAGEPVGVMKSGDANPSLYLELRRQGQPINPLPWLAARDGKVSG